MLTSKLIRTPRAWNSKVFLQRETTITSTTSPTDISRQIPWNCVSEYSCLAVCNIIRFIGIKGQEWWSQWWWSQWLMKKVCLIYLFVTCTSGKITLSWTRETGDDICIFFLKDFSSDLCIKLTLIFTGNITITWTGRIG